MDGHTDDAKLRYLFAALMVLAPLLLALVYGVVREVPPDYGCNDEKTESAVIEAYREGALWLIVAAETVALAALVMALRALRGASGPNVRFALYVVGGAFGVAAVAWLKSDNSDIGSALIAGVVTAMAAGGGLAWVARDESPGRVAVRAALAAAALLPLGFVLGLVAYFGPLLLWVVLVVVTGAMLAWLAQHLGTDETGAWRALALTAVLVGVLVVPGETILIFSRGHGPPFC
jgi:hypothetical protein